MFIRPIIFNKLTGVVAAESTRHGGVSPAPYHSLNLGKKTDDDPMHTKENRRRFCEALGFDPNDLAWSYQTHGDQVRLVTAPGGSEGFDALITNTPGVLLGVSVADCTPILIADPVQGAVAAIHAGWRGTVAGIVSKTLQRMETEFGTKGADCLAYIGTCISAQQFEVGDEVAAAFENDFKQWDPNRQKFVVDLKKANAAQLTNAGVPFGQIEISPFCTILNNADYFSHRYEKGITGRMMAVIVFNGE